MTGTPILYSFRRCPYAIRARLAVAYAGVEVELREVVLKNKPEEMLEASAKGTVPVLVLPDGNVIDESIDVMHWALDHADAEHWSSPTATKTVEHWIEENDGQFKHWLDRYKYADRHPEHSQEWYRERASAHLSALETALADHCWLHGDQRGFADAALFPFIRQFAFVDMEWFATNPYPNLRAWLNRWLKDRLFLSVMDKYPRWEPDQAPISLPVMSRAA